MVLSYSPSGNVSLTQFLIVHVGTLAGEVGSDPVSRASTLVPVPLGGVVSAYVVDNVIGFLPCMSAGEGDAGGLTHQWPIVITIGKQCATWCGERENFHISDGVDARSLDPDSPMNKLTLAF